MSSTAPGRPLTVHIWSDIACPWCFIGKRRFEAAVREFGSPVEVEYHSFLLAPDSPTDYEGNEVDYLASRIGVPREQVEQMLARVTEAGAGEIWGGGDYTGRIQNFELQLRSEGSQLFSEDGEPGFDEERLTEFWEEGAPIREGISFPQQLVEELTPLGPFDTGLAASELTWDNFGAGYLGNLGEGYTELGLIEPPVTEEGAKDLYLKPSMLHAVSAKTEHPEAAATLVNFLINSPQSGEIFGTNRGIPASETALEAAELDPLSQQVADYEASIADRLGDAPPVPIVGYGTLEEKFRQLGTELNFGTMTVEDAVAQFFSEMDLVLNQ